MWVGVFIHVEARGRLWVPFFSHFHVVLRPGLSLNLKLIGYAGWPMSFREPPLLSASPSAGVSGIHYHAHFYLYAGGPNPSPHAYITNTLTTEPSL